MNLTRTPLLAANADQDNDLGFDPDSPDVNDPATDPPHPPPIDNPAHHSDKQPPEPESDL
ncbi:MULTISPECIES: DUF6021 family protein [unclassified Pseudomonas]|uniref:DUF6021 family protein n=1 Tax=unclassified Pseudomonas TaxID=196821 RepID=UPI0002F5D5A4|nr:DUF6021 family protein [Pseudomonas sp. M47T1]